MFIVALSCFMRSYYNQIARTLACIAIDAGAAIMLIYNRAEFLANAKIDGSPVTIADQAAETIVIQGLERHFPDIQIVAEEASYNNLAPLALKRFFLVDALDGTREFIEKRPEFTVNIALIENGKPVAGAVYSPASGELYLGATSAFRGHIEASNIQVAGIQDLAQLPALTRIAARTRHIPLVAAISRAHIDDNTTRFCAQNNVQETIQVGSSIKFCRIAEGHADIYPRFSPTMEWDTAAGHAIINAAGGAVLTLDGKVLMYGKEGYKNGAFVAWGR